MLNPVKPGKSHSTWLLEAVLGLAALVAVNLLLYRQDPGFSQASPHPFWIVVVLLAARYGFRAGLASGILAGAAYLVLRAQAVETLDAAQLKSFALWGRPLLFAAVGGLLGEIRQAQIRRYQDLEQSHRQLEGEHEGLQKQYDALITAKQEIDTRIISQEQTLSTLYEAAQGLRSLEEQDIYPTVLELLHDYLKVEDGAVYAIEGDHLRLKNWLGPAGAEHPPTPSLDDPMLGPAVSRRETVSLDMVLAEKAGGETPLIAAPITGIGGRRVLGVLVVWSMPFLKFTPDAVNMVSLMADWCGESMENARLYQQTKDKLIADETIDAYTPEYLRRRLQEEFNRSKRYHLPLSLLLLEFPSFRSISDEDRQDALLTLSLVLKNWTRDIDLLFLGDGPGRFILLLPNTNLEGARVVARNIGNTFSDLREGMSDQDTALEDIRIGVAAFDPEMEDSEQMLDAAAEDAQHVRRAH